MLLLFGLIASLDWSTQLREVEQLRYTNRFHDAELRLRSLAPTAAANATHLLEWHWSMGSLLYDQGRYAQALPHYQRLTTHPAATALLAAEGHVGLLQSWLALGDLPSARAHLLPQLPPHLPPMLIAKLHALRAYAGNTDSFAPARELLATHGQSDPLRALTTASILSHAAANTHQPQLALSLGNDSLTYARLHFGSQSPILLSLYKNQFQLAARLGNKAIRDATLRDIFALLPTATPVPDEVCRTLLHHLKGRERATAKTHCQAGSTSPLPSPVISAAALSQH